MRKMEVTLVQDGEKKTYFSPDFISGRMMRRAMEIRKEMDLSFLGPEELDEVVDYLCEVFGNQFTRDQVYDGLDLDDLDTFIRDTLLDILYPKRKRDEENADDKKK
ncbi:phage tail assembly chaperone G [Halalkalibacterium halodurans]|uniref:phage tail assembly chaperone G n=1 Tax=Halalkalibacterium halodurans TaxID=86665 RepID=UPI002AAA04BB|nr:hypothetical protein [Halalkalibacterium halodurans]MDY7222089.1 hypothetical protein [Halalkalibacterium halodurans]MDY7243892.1 hypothetical protein [Halalkalibacterium halodurans]